MNGPPIFDPETGEVVDAMSASSGTHVQAMSLDDARALLVKAHGVAIGNDDPILMMVTLHQGMINDNAALLKRHEEKTKLLLGLTGEACAEAVEKVLASLKDRSVLASIEQAFALVSAQAVTMDNFEQSVKRHRRFLGILTAISMASAVLAIAILIALLK